MAIYSIPLVNGTTVVSTSLPEDRDLPYHQLGLTFTSAPLSGRMTVEYQMEGDPTWLKIPEANQLKLVETSTATFYARAVSYRFTISDVSGGSGLKVVLKNMKEWPGDLNPSGLYVGLRAVTQQNYTEANVKNGVQYEASSLVSALAAGSSSNVVFTTGNFPIVVKARQVTFNGTSLRANVYRSPVFTGGTPTPYFNLNDINPVTGGVTILVGATITNPGVEFGAPTYMLGSTGGVGQSVVSTFTVTGQERVLRPNTTYVLQLTNTSAEAQDIVSYLSWYEGGTDLPRNN